MNIAMAGIDHRRASLQLRERFAFTKAEAVEALATDDLTTLTWRATNLSDHPLYVRSNELMVTFSGIESLNTSRDLSGDSVLGSLSFTGYQCLLRFREDNSKNSNCCDKCNQNDDS